MYCCAKGRVFSSHQVMLDLHTCPGLQLEVFVATAVVATDQARRVCPDGRKTALNQVKVAVAVEAKVELGVVVQNRRGKVLDNLIVVLDLTELAVVRDNVEVSVVIDVELQVMRFMCGHKEVYVTKLSVAVMASLGVLPGGKIRKGTQGERLCYLCGSPDHFARDCMDHGGPGPYGPHPGMFGPGMPPMGVPPCGGGYNMEWHGPPMHPHAGPFGYGEGMHGPGPGPMPFDRPMMPGPGYGGPPFGMPPMYPGVPHHGVRIQAVC